MKTKKYILVCLFGILSFCATASINTVSYATTDHCVDHPEDCDPCLNDPASCQCQNGATNYPDCNDYCTNGATNYPECTLSCDQDPNQPQCPHDCHYYNNCPDPCDTNPNLPQCPKKDPCKENPNLPQCKKNPCPNGVQSLSYCTDKPGE